jgi:hypothetical protein
MLPTTRKASSKVRPALLTGTSSEYLGKRPLPRVLHGRMVILVLGAEGVGKSTVARRLAALPAAPVRGRGIGEIVVLDPAAVQDALVERIARRRWSERLVDSKALVLDGPSWMRARPAAVNALVELVAARAATGRRTVICQGDDEATMDALLAALQGAGTGARMPCEPALVAILGLRFPKGDRGRLRFARRACDELDINRLHAKEASLVEPWGYEAVVHALKKQAAGSG